MSSWLSSLGDTIKNSAEDLTRGVQGKETGRAESVVVTFEGSALGLTVSDHGGEGVLSALAPGGEAERLGLKLGDRVVAVGGAPTFKYPDVVDAIRSRPDRPLQLNLERRSASEGQLGLVTFRLDEECDKAQRILAKMLESPTTGPRRDVLARARGLALLRRINQAWPPRHLRDSSSTTWRRGLSPLASAGAAEKGLAARFARRPFCASRRRDSPSPRGSARAWSWRASRGAAGRRRRPSARWARRSASSWARRSRTFWSCSTRMRRCGGAAASVSAGKSAPRRRRGRGATTTAQVLLRGRRRLARRAARRGGGADWRLARGVRGRPAVGGRAGLHLLPLARPLCRRVPRGLLDQRAQLGQRAPLPARRRARLRTAPGPRATAAGGAGPALGAGRARRGRRRGRLAPAGAAGLLGQQPLLVGLRGPPSPKGSELEVGTR
uniref:PDZ domain-containing protein n=1 Tax=Pelagomonas calceolata TaxID=35677 RepID=A0A6S8SKV9_9STRA